MNRARPYILVVDDLPDAADSLADLIDLWGYHAEAHYGGPSALAAARRRPPAVVVLDIAMPRMDGFALAVRLRELPGCAGTALVALSGRTGGDSQARCCRLRIGHYLFKPVDPQVVRRLLASLVADSEAAAGRTELPVTPGPETCGPESCDFLRKLSTAAAERSDPLLRTAQGCPIDLLDVRTPTEYREVHVEGARNVPLDRLDPAAVVQSRVGPAGDPVYVVCRSGGRGAQACERFAGAGFPNAVNVAGGTLACVEAGLPVVRGPKALSLERQVRVAAGRRRPDLPPVPPGGVTRLRGA